MPDPASFYAESATRGNDGPTQGHTYKQSGVDIQEAASLVGNYGQLVKRTQKKRQLAGAFGLFAAAYDLSAYKHPVIVTGCDGVGTKLELLLKHDLLEVAGKDLVAMNVNDVLTTGADPILFLDYVGIARIEKEKILRIVSNACGGVFGSLRLHSRGRRDSGDARHRAGRDRGTERLRHRRGGKGKSHRSHDHAARRRSGWISQRGISRQWIQPGAPHPRRRENLQLSE